MTQRRSRWLLSTLQRATNPLQQPPHASVVSLALTLPALYLPQIRRILLWPTPARLLAPDLRHSHIPRVSARARATARIKATDDVLLGPLLHYLHRQKPSNPRNRRTHV